VFCCLQLSFTVVVNLKLTSNIIFLQSVIYCNTWCNKARMELSDVGEHVFAAECIMMSRMNKKVITGPTKRSRQRRQG